MTTSAAVPSVFDLNNLAALKGAVKQDDPKALKAAAQQFEALFLQMVLKSMRDATPHEGIFDSEQTRLYESLLDQQLTQVMAAKGGSGLAAVIEKQLSRGNGDLTPIEGGLPLVPPARALPLDASPRPLRLEGDSVPGPLPLDTSPVAPRSEAPASPAAREFVARAWPHAVEAARATGIPAHFLVAQAALETGWGRAEPRLPDGRPSNNLFGIKAGRNWSGEVAETATTEYVDGVPQQRSERFRAYASYADSFRDYAQLLASNPRYAGVLGSQDPAGFARGLQRAGYATDPMYASKLERIIGGASLRSALTG